MLLHIKMALLQEKSETTLTWILDNSSGKRPPEIGSRREDLSVELIAYSKRISDSFSGIVRGFSLLSQSSEGFRREQKDVLSNALIQAGCAREQS